MKNDLLNHSNLKDILFLKSLLGKVAGQYLIYQNGDRLAYESRFNDFEGCLQICPTNLMIEELANEMIEQYNMK